MIGNIIAWVFTGIVALLLVVLCIVLYVNSGDDTPVANTNNIQTPSNPESNSRPDLNTPIINPNVLTPSTPYSGVKTNVNGFSWSNAGDR